MVFCNNYLLHREKNNNNDYIYNIYIFKKNGESIIYWSDETMNKG